MELIVLILCCCLATVSSITTTTVTVSYATSTLNSASSTMLQSNVNSSENTTQTTNTSSVATTSTNTSETINTTTLPSSSQSSTSITLTTTQTSNTISTSQNTYQGSSSVVTTTNSPTTTLTQASATTSVTSTPSPESTSISSPAQTATSTSVTTLSSTTSSTATTAAQTSIPTTTLFPTTFPTTIKTTSQPTTTASSTSDILSMNVTAAVSHFAYFELNSNLLNSLFACLCGNSYQCRIPLTYRSGSNYIYDPGDVKQSGETSSNEIFICRIEELNILPTSALNCSRGLPSCDNCGHFNFTTSQCDGRSTQVKWLSTQSVALGYNANNLDIVCDSSKVQCVQRNDFTVTPPPAISGTTTTTTVKAGTAALTQSDETGNTGLILGLVFGFLVLAVVVAMAIFWWKQRNDRMRGSTAFDDDSTPAQFTNGSPNDYVTSSTSTAKANNARPYVNIGIKDGRNGSGISGEYNAGYQEVELLAHPGTGNGKVPPHPQDPGLKTKPDLNFNQTDEPDGEDDSDSSWSDESEQEDDTEPNNEYSRLGNIAAKQNLNDYGAANSPSSSYNVTATPTSGQQSRDLPHPPPQVIELSTPGVKLKNDYDYPTVSYPRESKIYNEVDDEEEGGAPRNSEVYTTINETQLPEPQSRGSNYNPYFELDIDSMYGSKSGT